jgi:hypothetical protein
VPNGEKDNTARELKLAREELYYDSIDVADTWELAHARHRGELEVVEKYGTGQQAKEVKGQSRKALATKQIAMNL